MSVFDVKGRYVPKSKRKVEVHVYKVKLTMAHRSPKKLAEVVKDLKRYALKRGLKVKGPKSLRRKGKPAMHRRVLEVDADKKFLEYISESGADKKVGLEIEYFKEPAGFAWQAA